MRHLKEPRVRKHAGLFSLSPHLSEGRHRNSRFKSSLAASRLTANARRPTDQPGDPRAGAGLLSQPHRLPRQVWEANQVIRLVKTEPRRGAIEHFFEVDLGCHALAGS